MAAGSKGNEMVNSKRETEKFGDKKRGKCMGEGNGRATGEEILAIFKSEWKAISRRWTLLQGLEDVCMQRYDLQRKATAVM